MSRFFTQFDLNLPSWQSSAVLVGLISCNLLFNILANASFKLSAASPTWRGFLNWQIIGNLAGFVTVLTLTALLRSMPLHVIFPLTTGLAVIGVQVVAAKMLFGETISHAQWWGTLLIVAGVVLLGEH
jgi:multidrug transporter EmrE-like cation transporter